MCVVCVCPDDEGDGKKSARRKELKELIRGTGFQGVYI